MRYKLPYTNRLLVGPNQGMVGVYEDLVRQDDWPVGTTRSVVGPNQTSGTGNRAAGIPVEISDMPIQEADNKIVIPVVHDKGFNEEDCSAGRLSRMPRIFYGKYPLKGYEIAV